MRKDAFNLDKVLLKKLYIDAGLPCNKIAEVIGAAPTTIKRYLKLYGFKIRPESTYKTLPLPKDEIIDLYTKKGLSATKIARQYNTSTPTILSRLKGWGIEVLHGTSISKICNYSGCSKSIKVWPKDIRNSKYGYFYCCKDHAGKGIAERGVNTGENSATWKGGIAHEPYCPLWLDKEFKESIKARDNYRCQNPDCWGTADHLPLVIMHIDNDKKNCHPDNLITGCFSCNSRAQKDREWHTSWYTAIMQRSGKTINNALSQLDEA